MTIYKTIAILSKNPNQPISGGLGDYDDVIVHVFIILSKNPNQSISGWFEDYADVIVPDYADVVVHVSIILSKNPNRPISGGFEDYDDVIVHVFIILSKNLNQPINPDNLQVGMTFPTKDVAMQCVKEYHMHNSTSFVVAHSDSTRWIVHCKNKNCMWRCRILNGKKSNIWKITKLEGPHTCSSTMVSQDHQQLSSAVICESILQMVTADPTISVSVLIAHIRSRYTYTTTYRKTWIAKQQAIDRIYGTVTDIEVGPFIEDGQRVPSKAVFHRLFWSFQPCIRGFDHCKLVVSVDGTWLYGKYCGTLLMAIAQDGNGHTIPIAYAIVEGETSDGWFFFLSRLRMFVTPQPNLCLISDRHESIKSDVRRVNNNWHHVFCVRHISQNFMRTFKNGLMKDLVTNMGYAMTQPSITYFRRQISDWSQDAVKWLDDIPKEQWLQAYDEGRRWGHMTTNLSECMNNVLKGTHNLPISSLVQATYYKVSAKFEERGTHAQAMMTSGLIYSNTIIQNLNKERAMSNSHEVVIHNRAHSIFTVKELVRPPSGRTVGTFKVDLDKRWCDCGEFQALHYPCSHVIAACSFIHRDYMMYVSSKYTLQCIFDVYKEEFPAIPLQSYWPEYNGIELCHNPAMRRDPKGRPQSTRIHTEMDQREKNTHPKRCGLCRNEGHSKNKCPYRPDAPNRN
uniref:Uncharacterized protein LOC105852148 n=2 Tax=Cicer arietinum TaxID=3827 RepID=A0A1S3E623_CICAR|nr:uncharacterized protein LOC105852148 [Cicer arietinum]